MQPDPTNLLNIAGIQIPLIGFYDAPDPSPFNPLIEPPSDSHICVFAFFKQWLNGRTLHLTKERYGCAGAGHHLFGLELRSREDFVRFLVDEEGLKASHELMNRWVDERKPYQLEHEDILIGPLIAGQYEYLKSIIFFVNPDQLGLLILGAQYYSVPGDPSPVIAPFGSGCMQLVTLFTDPEIPQAIIGATDIAMRQYLPPDVMAFIVTKKMFEQLCALDERSFLYKPFWKRLKKSRSGSTNKK